MWVASRTSRMRMGMGASPCGVDRLMAPSGRSGQCDDPPSARGERHAVSRRAVPVRAAVEFVVHRGEGDAILLAVRRGHELPFDQCPATSERDSDAPHINTLASLLGVVLSEFCARMKLASNLVATTYDLKSLVRARQPGAKLADDSSFISGWRSQEVRPHLDAVLDGTQVIRVSNPGSANPITIHPISPNTDVHHELHESDE